MPTYFSNISNIKIGTKNIVICSISGKVIK